MSVNVMTTLRLSLLVALFMAGFSAASFWATCPLPMKNVYGPTNVTGAGACANALCACIGATSKTNGSLECEFAANATRPSCATAANCSTAYITCMNAVTGISDLHMSLLAIASGELYNQSVAQADCKFLTCHIFNRSVIAANCSIPYEKTCKSPAVFRGTLRISGNFTAILANATARLMLTAAVEKDLSAVLSFPATVTDLQEGSLIVFFEVPVAAGNAVLMSRLQAAATDSSWLVNTQAAYTTLGGVGRIGVLSIGSPSPSTATPSGPTEAPITLAPLPTPSPTTSGAVQVSLAAIAQILFAAVLAAFVVA